MLATIRYTRMRNPSWTQWQHMFKQLHGRYTLCHVHSEPQDPTNVKAILSYIIIKFFFQNVEEKGDVGIVILKMDVSGTAPFSFNPICLPKLKLIDVKAERRMYMTGWGIEAEWDYTKQKSKTLSKLDIE